MSAEWRFLLEQLTLDIHTGKQDRALKWIPLSFFIGKMQSAPKEYHDPGSQLCKIMQDRYGRCETDEEAGGPVTLGHVHSSSLMLRLASHHLAVFRSFLLVG